MNETIMIVEDEGITALHLRQMFTSWGYRVAEPADRAEDAMDRIAIEPPDLVVMDIRLKGQMDGVTAADLLRGRFNVPVVILSAHNDEGTVERVRSSRAYGFVVKPFDEREVYVAVKMALFRHRIDNALREQRGWHDATSSKGTATFIATDSEGRVMFMSTNAEKLTGWMAADVFERHVTSVLRITEAAGYSENEHPVSRLLRRDGAASSEFNAVFLARDDSEFATGCRVAPLSDEAENFMGWIISLRPQRDLRQNQDLGAHQIQHDLVTGLADRTLLVEYLSDAIARARLHDRLVAVLILDLDRFKEINDHLGRAVGDLLLGAVSARIQNGVRGTDSVARVGGDEIAIIQPDLENLNGAVILAEKVVGIFSDPFVLEGHEIKTTTSVGISVYPVDGNDPEQLIRLAQEAVEGAKAAGRNQHQFFADQVADLMASQRSLEGDLRLAMERDQLVLLFQPIFDLGSQEIAGAEALLHWRHPSKGMIPAAKFVPLADRCGLLPPITDWILHQALEHAGRWQAKAPGIRVSVNITGSELGRRDLVPSLIYILRDSSLEARHLEIEIREDALIRPRLMNERLNLQRLRQLGVCLTLDNFGLAYASMMSLKNLPLNRLKIDRSLVAGVIHDPEAQAIVKATIDLARGSGLEVVATGIENEAQLRWLRFHGCDQGQGNHLGAPMPAEGFLNPPVK